MIILKSLQIPCNRHGARHLKTLSSIYLRKARILAKSNQNINFGEKNSYFTIKCGLAFIGALAGLKVYSDKDKNENINAESDKLKTGQSLKTEIHDIVEKKFLKESLPGMSYLVLVDGIPLVADGMGYADIEKKVKFTPSTVMRIASISKPLTMTVVGKLMEGGKLDIDKAIQEYISGFPKKQFNGKDVTITTRHLLNHSSGIRHYLLKHDKPSGQEVQMKENNEGGSDLEKAIVKQKHLKEFLSDLSTIKRSEPLNENFNLEEFHIKDSFYSVKESMELFKSDELLFEPGSKYGYTTHGWTVVSAIIEAVTRKKFTSIMKNTFKDLGMSETYLDNHKPIIFNRACHYTRASNGGLMNAPYVDNSYKYAGGGFISTVKDIGTFGLEMLYSAQNDDGYLKRSTIEKMWSVEKKEKTDTCHGEKTGLGWFINEKTYRDPFIVSHTGGAIGGSSILSISTNSRPFSFQNSGSVKGIIVVMFTNIDGINFRETSREVINAVNSYKNKCDDFMQEI